jgi:predicted ribosomally synthesized peptide with SipW-like signal peptide
MNKKIVLSLCIIGAAAAIAAGGTIAFFSDKEVSAGNVFTAGGLDLQIDSDCTYNGKACVNGVWEGTVDACSCVFAPKNLAAGDLLFDFDDIKPGDKSEDTISMHVANDSWACMAVKFTEDSDNTCVGPELAAEPGCTPTGDGEVDENMTLKAWRDTNCDNVWDTGEVELVKYNTPDGWMYAIADATTGDANKLIGGQKSCVGVEWSIPNTVGNEMQTDTLKADFEFAAEQWRNNPNFTCGTPIVCAAGQTVGCVQPQP